MLDVAVAPILSVPRHFRLGGPWDAHAHVHEGVGLGTTSVRSLIILRGRPGLDRYRTALRILQRRDGAIADGGEEKGDGGVGDEDSTAGGILDAGGGEVLHLVMSECEMATCD